SRAPPARAYSEPEWIEAGEITAHGQPKKRAIERATTTIREDQRVEENRHTIHSDDCRFEYRGLASKAEEHARDDLRRGADREGDVDSPDHAGRRPKPERRCVVGTEHRGPVQTETETIRAESDARAESDPVA